MILCFNRPTDRLKALLVGVVSASLLSCAHVHVSLKGSEGEDAPASFLAGAAKADITPPPGFPMGGHSVAGHRARGYWTRLYARAVYMQDRRGHELVLVACDLWSMPGGLGDRVAELLLSTPNGGS